MSPKFCLRAGALVSQFLECCFLRTQRSLPRNCSQHNEAVCLAYDSSRDSLHSVTGPDRKKKKGCPCLARRAGPPQLHDLAEAFVETASQFKFSLCLIFLPLLPPSLRIFPINFLYTNLHLKVCFPEVLIWDVHLREKIQNTCHNCCKPVLSRMGFMEKVKP